MVATALKKTRSGDRYYAIVTIDVKNAFNSVSWEAIALSLLRMGVPDQLSMILKSYFENRVLLYDTEEGQKSVQVTWFHSGTNVMERDVQRRPNVEATHRS